MNQIIRAGRILTGEIVAGHVRIVGRPHPFQETRVDLTVPAGLSIKEILEEYAGRGRLFAVAVDEEPVPTEWWPRVRPRAGTTLTFRARLSGGNLLRSALMLAITIAAIAIAGPGGLALTGTLSAAFVAGVSIVGSLLVNALFPIKPPKPAEEQKSLASVSGGRNEATPFGAVPVVLGRHRFAPRLGARFYTELVGDDQYLRGLLIWGYGPLTIEDIRIGETPLSSFEGVEIETREGYATDAPLLLYSNNIHEEALSVTLSQPAGGNLSGPFDGGPAEPNWQYRTTQADVDAISIDVTAPNGVFQINKKTGNPDPYTVRVVAEVRNVAGTDWISFADLSFSRTTGTQRLGQMMTLPLRAQYEVRVRKVTTDAGDTNIRDEVIWTALRSIRNEEPVRFPKPLAKTAFRIKATDQLSGAIDTLNGIVFSKVNRYTGAGVWTPDRTSNRPADLFRHVLQGPANQQPVPDEEIDLENLQEWTASCTEHDFHFNLVLTEAQSVYDTLSDIAASGRAVPTFIDGKWGVMWDRPDATVVQHFTPRNSWGFSASRTPVKLPHGFRVRFINQENGYTEDEIIVYDDGYDATSATFFEGVDFKGVTRSDLNWKHGRFHIAQLRLRPEIVTLMVGWENIVCSRGDRVRLTHDAMLIGLGSGRVRSVALEGGNTRVQVDEILQFDAGKTYSLRVRLSDGTNTSRPIIVEEIGETNSILLTGPIPSTVDAALGFGDLFSFGETGRTSAIYRVKEITRQRDLIAQLTLVDDAPGIAQADTGEVPPYEPNVTPPADLYSVTPRHLTAQEIIDGSGSNARAVLRLTWQVPRFARVAQFLVQERDVDAGGAWLTIGTVAPPSTTFDAPLISAGIWDYRVCAIYADGTPSGWATLSGLELLGLSRPPADIVNYRFAVIAGRAHLSWDAVEDQRGIYYEIRRGESWESAQVVGDNVLQPPWQTVGDGVYWIASYVVSPFGTRIYSDGRQSIDIAESVLTENVVVTHDEQAEGWPGYKHSLAVAGGYLRTGGSTNILTETSVLDIESLLDLGDQQGDIYVATTIVDIGRVAACRVSMDWEAVGVGVADDILTEADILGDADILRSGLTQLIRVYPVLRMSQAGFGDNDAFAEADIFAADDAFLVGIEWGTWLKWSPDYYKARLFQVGLQFEILDPAVIGTALKFKWTIDVPDRFDRYQNLVVPDTGLAIAFKPEGTADPKPFMGGTNGDPLPHILKTQLNPTPGDEVRVLSLTTAGCTVFVYNSGSPVARTGVNIMAQGY